MYVCIYMCIYIYIYIYIVQDVSLISFIYLSIEMYKFEKNMVFIGLFYLKFEFKKPKRWQIKL